MELPPGTCVSPALEAQGTAENTGLVALLAWERCPRTELFSRG